MGNWYEENKKAKESECKEAKDKEAEKRQFMHDWKIAIFSALSGALLSEPVWWIIKKIIGAE